MSHTRWSDSEEISIRTSCWKMTQRIFCLLVIMGFCTMWQKADANFTLGNPILSGPPRALVGSIEDFYCKLDNIQTNETILYELFNEVDLDTTLAHHSSQHQEEATFPSFISSYHDGKLICKASVQNNSEISPTFSSLMNFSVVVPVKGAHIISSSPSEDLWERDSLTLQCNVTEGTYVSYEWFLNDRLLLNDSKDLHLSSLSSKDSGKYVCVAKNYLNETEYFNSRSDGRKVHVKVGKSSPTLPHSQPLTKPEISFMVIKNVDGSFNASVKCQVTKGSPPINFTLFINHKVYTAISEHQYAIFTLPITLDQDMGMMYCQANMGKDQQQSQNLPLKVEAVGGAVTMTLQKDIGKDFEVLSVRLNCKVERGTHPHYNWFINNTRLEEQSTFHPDNSGLTVRLYPDSDSGGFYHCEAFNSFDNTTRLRSPSTLISHEVFNKISPVVTATVLTFFSLMICAVLACCGYGVVLRKKRSKIYMYRLKDFTDKHSLMDEDDDDHHHHRYHDKEAEEIEENKYEEENNDLDAEEYIEDMEVVQASMMKDSDESDEEDEDEEEEETELH